MQMLKKMNFKKNTISVKVIQASTLWSIESSWVTFNIKNPLKCTIYLAPRISARISGKCDALNKKETEKINNKGGLTPSVTQTIKVAKQYLSNFTTSVN